MQQPRYQKQNEAQSISQCKCYEDEKKNSEHTSLQSFVKLNDGTRSP